MFYSLTGKLIHRENAMAVISCGGVGYKCYTSFNTARTLPKVGEEVTLFTHLHVKEDCFDLYGFHNMRELEFYKMLTNISGVGPKVGLALLSELTPDMICVAAAASDAKAFARANGVGPKLAQRIVLELKDKVGSILASDSSDMGSGSPVVNNAGLGAAEATKALMALGYNSSEAAFAVAKIDSSLKTEDIIRQALMLLAKK